MLLFTAPYTMFSLSLLFMPLCASLPLMGWVESPGYPRGYPEEASLKWTKCAPIGHALTLTITHLDLEDSEGCSNDALEITADNITLYTLCGKRSYEELQSSINPSLLSSSSGCMSLSFHSDYSNSERHSGFRAFYTVQDVDECGEPDHGCTQYCNNHIGGYRCSCRSGYFLDKDAHTCTVKCTEDLTGSVLGTISSPGRPGPYAENSRCSYTLSVEDSLQLVLQFTGEFDVEGQRDQCADSLMIRTPSRDLGPFCGQVAPPSPLLTGSHKVQIIFNTDGSGANTGFTISYSTTEKTCPTEVTSSSKLTPQLLKYRQNDQVTVTCDTGFFLSPVGAQKGVINNKTYVSTCGRTGLWSPVYNCEAVDCGFPSVLLKDTPLQMSSQDPNTLYKANIKFKCRSKYYVLEGEERYSCSDEGEWKSKSGQNTFPKCVAVCGRTDKEIMSISRILGGKKADKEQIPWHLLIFSHKGGASLINDQWAITAAHVIDQHGEKPLRMYGGVVSLRGIIGFERRIMTLEKAIEINPGLTVLEVEKVYIHPQYKKGFNDETQLNFDSDIALIKLKSRVNLGPNLLPVCLPEKTGEEVSEDLWGTVSGFGKTKTDMYTLNPDLLYVHVEVHSHSRCSQAPQHPGMKKPMIVTDNMFCAGGDGKDSCQGDSGGPFVIPPLGSGDPKNRKPYQIYGVVSWGVECGHVGYYTKVDKYLDWITQTMEGDLQKEH